MVLFGFLAIVSSTTVGKETSTTPLITLAVIAGIVTLYVFLYLPRLEKQEAEEIATRRAARTAKRSAGEES
jgi:heme/copper-type cytochrome/quinol oxidase subunit 4